MYDGAPGVPALGSNAPSTAEIISARTPTVIQTTDGVALGSIPIIRTVSGTQGRRAEAVHAVHALHAAPTVVRASQVDAVHAVHNLHAAPTVVRTAAPAVPSHIVTAPAQTVVRTVPQTAVVRAAAPAGIVHHSRTDPTSVVTPGRLLQLGGGIQVIGLDSLGNAGATVIEA